MAEKKVNYSEALTKELVEGYEAAEHRGAFIKEFAAKHDKSVRSVTQKLVTLKKYVAEPEAPKAFQVVKTKKELVKEIVDLVGPTDFDFEKGLSPATMPALNELLKHMR